MSKPSPQPPREKSAPGGEAAVQKRRANRRGRLAEWRVRIHLYLTGHQILAANFQCKQGEIDLIARRGKLVKFIEVKARPTQAQAAEAVGARQRARIQHAAEMFLTRHPMLQICDVRFDVALVTGPFAMHYVADAWRP